MRRIPIYTLVAIGLALLASMIYSLSLKPSESSGEKSERFLRRVVITDLLESETPPVAFGNFTPPALPDDYVETFGSAQPEPLRTPARVSLSRVFKEVQAEKGMVLELTGEVLLSQEWQPTVLQPKFSVLIDGKVVFEKSVALEAKNVVFSESIPLDSYASRTIDLLLQVDDKSIPDSIAWWASAWLTRYEETPRLSASTRRNVLLIVIDALRADHLGTYGYDRPVSPNIDAFADQGLVFEQAIAPCSWTQPSVATILTGLSPMTHGVIGGVAMDPMIETIGESLQRVGFTTLGVSANPIVGEREGFHRGFETFLHMPWQPAAKVNEEFGQWVLRNTQNRWFAYLHYIDPHAPYNPPRTSKAKFTKASYRGPFRDPAASEDLYFVSQGTSDRIPTKEDVEFLLGSYDGEIHYFDTEFANVLGTLRKANILDDTVVIITSDHGEEFGDHGKWHHGFQLYDELVRVPLIVRAPGLVKPGRRATQITLEQVMPMILRLAGIKRVDRAVERALFHERPPEFAAFSHTILATPNDNSSYESLASLRRDGWKMIRSMSSGVEKLYDLRHDPGERNDLATEETNLAAQYRLELKQWLSTDRRLASDPRADPGLIERLRALGYVN